MNSSFYNYLSSVLDSENSESTDKKEKNKFVNFEFIKSNTIRLLTSDIREEEMQDVISSVCKGGILTTDFVRDFKKYITPEAFSSSPCLSLSVVTQFPELFDYDVWFNSDYISASIILSEGFEEEDILPILKNIYYKDLELYSNEICRKFYEQDENALNYMVENFPNLNIDTLIEIGAISENLFQNENMIRTLKENPDYIDRIFIKLGNDITLNIILCALALPKNDEHIAWQLEKIRQFNKMDNIKNTGDISHNLIRAIENLNDVCIPELLEFVSNKNNGIVPYAALMQVISEKDLSEDELCNISYIFIKNGAGGPLLKYAAKNEYDLLKQILQINLF